MLCFRFCLCGLFCLWWFCFGVILNALFSVVDRVLTTELYVEFWDVLDPRCIPIGFVKLVNLGFGLAIVLLRDPRVDPLSLFACRMTRGQEETSTSQVRLRRGSNWELPTVSSLVASMSMEELRSFYRVPDNISLELSDGPTFSTI